MNKPRIYADYHKVDDYGRLILVCYGTIRDLEKYGIFMQKDLALTFYMDDGYDFGNQDNLLVDGIVEYNNELQQWVGNIDKKTFRHESDERESSSD